QSLGIQTGDRLCIQSESCAEWAFLDWACQTLGIVVVPIYPTLPADQAQYIVKDCGASLVVAGDASQSKKVEGLPDLKVVLLRGEGSLDELAKSSKHTIAEEAWDARIAQTTLDEVATIIY